MSKKNPVPAPDPRTDRLFHLIRDLTTKIEPAEALNAIMDAAVEITGATSGTLILVDWKEKVLRIEVQRGLSEYIRTVALKPGEGITGSVALTGKPALVADVDRDSRYVKIKKNIRSELAVPLILDKKVIGVVNVDTYRKNAFDREDLKLLTLLADQSARVIQNTRLYDTIQKHAEELKTLHDVNRLITGTLELDTILSLIAQKTTEIMGTKLCSIMLREGKKLVIRAVHGASTNLYANKPNLKIQKSLVGRAVRTGKPIQVLDVLREKNYHHPSIARKEGLRALLSVPLLARDRVIGCLNTYKSGTEEFGENEINLLLRFAGQSALAIENARLYREALQMENELRRLEKLSTAGEIAVGIAHEIRNPLTIINMLFQQPERMNREDIKVIRNELKRINNTVDYFLNFYKLNEPSLEGSMDIHGVIRQTLALVDTRMKKKKIRFQKSFAKKIPPISGDGNLLSQVILNIVLNAIDSMGSGGTLRIRTALSADGKRVKISITDTGSGVPEVVREKIFQPFVTTKPRGMGLGLSISRRIVKSHHGNLTYRKKQGGSCFVVEIPVERRKT